MVFKFYLRFLSLAYLIGFFLHVADILDLRLTFSAMDKTWQIWIVYLAVMDFAAAIGLWRQKKWGIYLFLFVAVSQLIAYLGFSQIFGRQNFLINFHLVTIAAFFVLLKKSGKLNWKMIKTHLNFMSKNISGHLAKAAIPFRWLSIVLTILIFLITKNNQFSTEWSTGLTAAGTLLGVYGAWLTLEIFKIGDSFGQQQQKLIEEVHSTVMTGAKTQHMQELRRKYEEAKTRNDDHAVKYWHFIWRFESYDFLGLSLEPNGYARVRILGMNNPAFETSYEKLENPIYTVDVYEVLKNTELKRGRGFCTSINGTLYISNNANEIELYNPMIKFHITGLGPISGGAVGPRPSNFKRLKDLRNPSAGNEDQG